MDIQQMRYAVALAETGSFTLAAKRSFVTQPSLSQQIQKLEDEVGQRLFHRIRKKVQPTAAGDVFLATARKILLETENLRRTLGETQKSGVPRLELGIIPTVASDLMPSLLRELREKHPHLHLHLREDLKANLWPVLMAGELDAAIMALPEADPQIITESLYEERLYLAMATEHPLAKSEKWGLAELRKESFVLPGESSSLGLIVQRFFADLEFTPKVTSVCTQLSTLKAMVAAGQAISILGKPRSSDTIEDTSQIVYRTFPSGTQPVRSIHLCFHRQRYLSPVARAAVGTIAKFCQFTGTTGEVGKRGARGRT